MKLLKELAKKIFRPGDRENYTRSMRSEIPPHLHKMPQKDQDEWAEYLERKALEQARPKTYSHNKFFEQWKRDNK